MTSRAIFSAAIGTLSRTLAVVAGLSISCVSPTGSSPVDTSRDLLGGADSLPFWSLPLLLPLFSSVWAWLDALSSSLSCVLPLPSSRVVLTVGCFSGLTASLSSTFPLAESKVPVCFETSPLADTSLLAVSGAVSLPGSSTE